MFWGALSVLSIVASTLLSSAVPQQTNNGAVQVQQNSLQAAGLLAPASGNARAANATATAAVRPHANSAKRSAPANRSGTFLAGRPGYCDASGGCDEYIQRVQLNEIDNLSGCDQYQDYSAISTTVVNGAEYQVTVTNGHPYSADVCSIWVDWNQDAVFDDAAPELIGDVVGGGITPPYSFTLSVPPSALQGYTRMRIRIDYSSSDPDPCGTTTYGEVEDYGLLVVLEGAGACCNIYDGSCLDAHEGPACTSLGSEWRWYYEQECAALQPPCGNPGACCDDESADCAVAFEAVCAGSRFLPGGTCEELVPGCGEWRPTAMLYAPTWSDNPEFRAAVSALLNSRVDFWHACFEGTPSLEYLSQYAAVMTWTNYPYDDCYAMGHVLADYVDAGGRVILGQWCRHCDSGNYLCGRIMDDPAYCPVRAVSTSFGSGSYAHDGVQCVHHGPHGEVTDYQTSYLDIVSQLAPDALIDGTFATPGSPPAVVWRPDYRIWYSPGNTGASYGSGDWAVLTANMVTCTAEPGACCDISTAECLDGVAPADCLDMGETHQWHFDTCADLDPPCSNPGACCDDATATCTEVLEYNCAGRFAGGATCDSDSFPQPCGEPLATLYCPTNTNSASFCAALANLVGPVDYFDASTGTPSLELLLNYSAVLTYDFYGYDDPTAMGDVLADYVDHGRRVILGYQCRSSEPDHGLAGRLMDDPAYCPVLACTTTYYAESYNHDGTQCPHHGRFGDITAYTTDYLDVVLSVTPGALTDGTWDYTDNPPAVIWRPDALIWYSPGHTGGRYGSGDWVRLTANMILCGGQPGACCDVGTGNCIDDVPSVDCAASGPTWRFYMGTCAELEPPCGNPGACCDSVTGLCTEVVEAACDERFLAGAMCEPDPFDPPCTAWTATGLLYAPAQQDNAEFRAAVATLLGQAVNYIDARTTTPTLEQMRQYRAVMTWPNYPYADMALMGDRLADYVDDRGRVILGQFCRQSDQGIYLAGRIMSDPAYCPVLACTTAFATGAYRQDGTQCVHRGPAGDVSSYQTTFLDAVSSLASGAVTDGTWDCTGNPPAVIRRPDARVWYSSGNTGMTFSSGDWARLTANMVLCGLSMCGDVNCDGAVSGYDIDPFVLALTDAAAYADAFPACDRLLADCNHDGLVNGYDIDPFVECLTAGGCGVCP
jgi:hypothetical protein